jgi:hypothetical protein
MTQNEQKDATRGTDWQEPTDKTVWFDESPELAPVSEITAEWIRDTAMNVMLATEVDEAVRILTAAMGVSAITEEMVERIAQSLAGMFAEWQSGPDPRAELPASVIVKRLKRLLRFTAAMGGK